jgi:hypothetical protein
MIIAVIEVVAFIVLIGGLGIIAVVIATTIFSLLDKGLNALILRRRLSPLHLSNLIEYKGGYSNHDTNQTHNLIHPHISPYKAVQNLITWLGNNALKIDKARKYYQKKDTEGGNKDYFEYLKRFVPIKHIGSIVNRLRRSVNQSGKEPTTEIRQE